MSKKRIWKTAQEFMDELNANPEFMRKKAQRDKIQDCRETHVARMEQPILDALRAKGFEATSLTDTIERFSPLSHEIVSVFLNAIETSSDLRLLETLIRGLTAAAQPFDGRPLAKCYDKHSDDNLRWVIANAIAVSRPHSIDDWIAGLLRNSATGKVLRSLGIKKRRN